MRIRKPVEFLLSIFLACVVALFSGIHAFALQYENFQYEIINDEARIIKYAPEKSFTYIPAEIDGYSVTMIGSRAFYGRYNNSNTEIPEGIRVIEKEAFLGVLGHGFAEVTIPNSVEEIGEYAFGYTLVSDDGSTFYYEKLENMTILGNMGSTAETYANENGFTFIALDEPEVTTTSPVTTTETTLVTTTNETTTIDTTTESTTLETTATTTTSTNTLTEGSDTTVTSETETTTTTSTDNVTEVTGTTDVSETETTTTTVTTNYKNITEEDFINWAINDYQSKTGITPANAVLSEISDGYYEITLVDDAGNVLDIYTVDPVTAIGKNQNGEEVNLPQTGYSDWYHTTAALAACMTIIGGTMVIGSGVLKKKRR